MSDYVLIVDDEPAVRELLSSQLGYLGYTCRATGDADEALGLVRRGERPLLVLADIEMPGISGIDLLRHLREQTEEIQIVMISGVQDLGTVRRCLRDGAYDYLVKPFEFEELRNTVERALERARLIRQNEDYRRNLERMVEERTRALRETRDIALFTLAKLAESRDSQTGHHLERMAEFSRRLAEELRSGPYRHFVTSEFSDQLHKSSPLHDIGKVGIPDSILLKPGPLDRREFEVMKTHTTIGGDTLKSVLNRYRDHEFLSMGMEIAYGHHEHWDGRGYPAGLTGEAIPLAARIVAIADAYDAVTSDRPYKRAESHEEAVRRLAADRERHFDPVLVEAFLRCQEEFSRIRERLADREPASRPPAGGRGA